MLLLCLMTFKAVESRRVTYNTIGIEIKWGVAIYATQGRSVYGVISRKW